MEYSKGGQCSLEYNTVLNVRRFHSVLHHVTFKVTQGKPGLNITKQISVQCKVCTCVAMPRYKSCLNNTGSWGEVVEGGSRIGNKWQVNCKEVTNNETTRDACKTLTSHPFQMKHLSRSSPLLAHDETKSFGSTPLRSRTRCYCKKFKMAIYIKSTILKLENSRNMLEIVFLCTLNMLNFKRLALIATEL